jgi:E3 SUMO-protein ligase PIAS1
MRIMVFCAGDNVGVQDIAFPHQSEIKVNGGEIKANLRGLKGKPGSTRPVDITDSLRLKQHNYVNNIEFTYALTNKVKKPTPEQPSSQVSIIIIIVGRRLMQRSLLTLPR